MKKFLLLSLFLAPGCTSLVQKDERQPSSVIPIAMAPKQIVSASKSVFLLILPDRPKVLDLSSGEKIKMFMNSQGQMAEFQKQIIETQIELCKMEKKLKTCSVSNEMLSATVFVMKDGTHLYSNFHPFFEYMQKIVKLNPRLYSRKDSVRKIFQTRLPVFIYDNNGELVFDPTKGSALINNVSMMAILADEEENIPSDYDFVELRLTTELKNVQPLQTANLIDHEKIYLLGFPSESNNIMLQFSAGESLPYEHASKILNMIPVSAMDSSDADRARNAKLFFKADSLPGMSGGPYLNEAGQVVGINRGIRESGNGQSLSIGIKANFMLSFPYEFKKEAP